MTRIEPRLATALRAIFVPLARILIRLGIGVRPVAELLRWSFVQAAAAELDWNQSAKSTSKIAEMTGLARKSVRELRFSDQPGGDFSVVFEPELSELLTFWSSATGFVDGVGRPRPLNIGPGPGTFAELVKRRLGIDDYRSVLKMLTDGGNVEITEKGEVQLKKRAWVSSSDAPMQLVDVIGTGMNSIEKVLRDKAFVERLSIRTVYTSNIDPKKIRLARRSMRDRTEQFTREIDDYFAAHSVEPKEPIYDEQGNKICRLGVGVVYFELEQ